MKTFLLVVLTVAALFIWQRNARESAVDKNTPANSSAPVPARKVSEHNWARHSLDRAHEVVGEVQQSREENQP